MFGLLGEKVGMTQVRGAAGDFSGVTVLAVGGCSVSCVRTKERDGYEATQVQFAPRGRSAVRREFRGLQLGAVGDVVSAGALDAAGKVTLASTSKGRGFAGVMKRHNFHGVCASHGVKKVHRSGGSTGQSTDPGRVFKGTKMPGRYGGGRVTVKNLKIAMVDVDRGLLAVRGAVPGPVGAIVEVWQ